jgi:hypothetical protein
MKLKTTALLAGICLAILAASPAYARSAAAYGTFKVWQSKVNYYGDQPYPNPALCLTEYYGEVVNQCSFEVVLAFDLPIDTDGSHYVSVTNLSYGSTATVKCTVSALTGEGSTGVQTEVLSLNQPTISKTATVDVAAGGTIQVLCYIPGMTSTKKLPNGISEFNWAP